MEKHKHGFTLAEVLITLVIIGIIAAMTIPTLMNKTNEQETVVALKKAYSTLGQAYQRMVAENGEFNPEYYSSSNETTKALGDIFAKQLNVQKNCGQDAGGECWSTQNNGMYKFLGGADWMNWDTNDESYYRVRLNDGSSLALIANNYYYERGTNEQLTNVYGNFFIDVNGDKQPNTLGKDVFAFNITKYGIYPYGTPFATRYPLDTCRVNGYGCTAWVIMKGNMDYLKKVVSW